MLGRLLDAVFGCWHQHYGFPITIRTAAHRPAAASLTGTYVVCLDCGRELPYDWKTMKIVSASDDDARAVRALATKEAS